MLRQDIGNQQTFKFLDGWFDQRNVTQLLKYISHSISINI